MDGLSVRQKLLSFAPMDFATNWRPGQALAAAGGMMVLMLLLDLAAFAAVLSWSNPGTLGSDAAFQALSDTEKYFPAIVSGLVMQLALIAGLLWLVGRGGTTARKVLMLNPPEGGLGASLRAVGGFLLLTYLLAGAVYLLFPYDPLEVAPFMKALINSPYWWVLLIMIVFGAPLFEELWFRGFLFPALAQSKLGVAGAAIVSSGLWTLLHLGYPPQVLVVVFVIGLFLTDALLRSGSLWLPIACHAIYNGSSFAYFLMLSQQPPA